MKNNPGTKLKGKTAVDLSYQQEFKEEISMENLAKEALAKTIREGGAFARKNSEQFKQ